MSVLTFGLLAGLGFGLLDIAVMLPMKFENRRKKTEALSAAFIERFMIGLLIPQVSFALHPAITGVVLGFALSVPSAIITRAWAPILGIGVLGGLVIGFIANTVL